MSKGDAYTLHNWLMIAKTQPKPGFTRKLTSAGAISDDGDGGGYSGESAAEQLNRLCAAHFEVERVKFGRTVQLIDAPPIVWRKHPEVVRRWHEQQND